jgi:hypothetical protein
MRRESLLSRVFRIRGNTREREEKLAMPEPYDQDTEHIDEALALLSDVFAALEAYRLTHNDEYLGDAMWSLAEYRVAGGEIE